GQQPQRHVRHAPSPPCPARAAPAVIAGLSRRLGSRSLLTPSVRLDKWGLYNPRREDWMADGVSAGHLELVGLSRHFGDTLAVDRVSLTILAGEFVTLLGPSGSGKTTTLMMIAGFVRPSAGEIHLAGRPITRTPPYRRNVGMVFQNYALFPHMTVFNNVAFSLEMRGIRKREIAGRVGEALDLVKLAGYEGRLP